MKVYSGVEIELHVFLTSLKRDMNSQLHSLVFTLRKEPQHCFETGKEREIQYG
jgi:hypothetical protein